MLNPTPFQDADGLAVPKPYASQHGLKTIADMTKVGAFTYGGPPENGTRFQGVMGLKQAYGLNKIQFKPLPIGTQYQALNQRKIDSIAIFTTDGQLASGKYSRADRHEGRSSVSSRSCRSSRSRCWTKMGPAFCRHAQQGQRAADHQCDPDAQQGRADRPAEPGDVAKAFLKANDLA